MALALFGALFIGLSLGLLGSGGSILTVPILVYLVGRPEKQAIAESLAIVGCIALVGALRNAMRKQVDLRSVLIFGLAGMIGAYGGAAVARWLPGELQLVLLALLMLIAAVLVARRSRPDEVLKAQPRNLPGAPLLAVQGACVGVLTGLLGVGGGFLIVPALMLMGGLSMHTAIGTSLAIITLNCATGFLKYQLVLGEQEIGVDWQVIAVFSAVGIAGSLAGTSLAGRLNQQVLRRVFAIFIVLMAVYILVRELPDLL